MSTFTKYPNSAKWIIAILLLLNVLCLAALWFGRPDGRHHQRGHQKLIHQIKKELNLNEQQTLELDNMVKRQRQEQEEIKDQLMLLKGQLREAAAATPTDTAKAQQAAQEIGQKNTQIELNIIRHLEEMKGICTPEQLQKLQQIIAKPGKHKKRKK